ncbi:Bug family tripartite tricarboxylate transporter substrate binding protein [Falsiroseomonas oryzae]|uniref:Bug family tripartite tricarboxylate transporter substrate binding protein n=1 Tax=Falsiroseomonas oryzae TaxID=2766473 RepID=UPI0022EB7ED5|nr:tripartite tricarboxylate transporter substrate-binding protein [Roseomonas sp. MO-31]
MTRPPSVARRALLGAAALAPLAAPVAAQPARRAWPDRPIRFLQGFAAGGATDIVARMIAPAMAAEFGQPVVVENRPGAGGTLAAEALARAPKDGHTLMLINNGFAVSAALYRRLPYDPIADVEPVSLVCSVGLVLLAGPAGAPDALADFADLRRRAQAQPERLNVATVGVGSTQHLVAEATQAAAGFRLTHVPYRGTPAALVGLRNAEVQVVVEPISAVLGQIRDGGARALAVTSRERSPLLPDVPTVAELLGQPDFDIQTWYAVAAPGGTPGDILARIDEVTRQVTATPEMRARLEEMGLAPRALPSPAAVRAMVHGEIARWTRTVEAARIERQ